MGTRAKNDAPVPNRGIFEAPPFNGVVRVNAGLIQIMPNNMPNRFRGNNAAERVRVLVEGVDGQ